jgi:hypothetical protein
MASREMKLRRDGACVTCGVALDAGTRAWWDAEAKTVTCLACRETVVQPVDAPVPEAVEIDRGVAGGSIAREHERRKAKREQLVRERHPRTARIRLALQDAPRHEEAFRKGAAGEREVANSLAKRLPEGVAEVLHNRRMPGGRGDIDHLAVSATAVWVIDAKNYTGKVRIERPLFSEQRLLIRGRNRSKLLDGMDRQVAAVRDALVDFRDVPIHGILCFTEADGLPMFRREVRGHTLLHHSGLARSLKRDGPLDAEQRATIARLLAQTFPPA